MNTVGALIIRLTHTGLKPDGSPNLSSVTLYDLDEPTASVTRPRSVPIPPGATVDIPMSTRTFISWADGAICKFIREGYLTGQLLLQLRDKGNCGGPAGLGQDLLAGTPNIERVSNTLRLVMPDNLIPTTLETVGYLVGEEVEITGLVGAFVDLNGTYTIETASPGTGLAGAAVGSYLIELPSVGPDIPAIIHVPGVLICLTQGRITVELAGSGNAGGLGASVFGYIAGQLFPNAGGGGGSTILVADEGTLLTGNPFSTLNFIGSDVLADNGVPGTANIYIPPPSFLSHWNTSDGSNGAQFVTESISRTTARISTPAGGEGSPFNTNGWAGTNQDASIDGTVTNTTPANTTGFGGDSTMTVTVYDADGTTVLDSFTTPVLTANAVHVSGSTRITVTITGFAADSTRFQANASVATDIDGIFSDNALEGGRYHVEVTHTTDSTTDGTGPYTYVQSDVFYDDNPTTPAINGTVSIGETGGGVLTKHLSGLEYYILGSAFTVGITDIDQLNRDTQRVPTNTDIDGTEYGLGTLAQAPFGAGSGNFSGWTNDHDQDNVDYSNTAITITAASYRLLSPTANVEGQVRDSWALGAAVPSPDAAVLIDTFITDSTALSRDYNDEARRQDDTHNGGGTAGNWTSATDLNTISYAAQGAIRILTAPLTVGDTFTIGGTTFTGVAGARTSGADDFDATLGTPLLLQAELIAAINDPANGTSGVAVATASTFGSGSDADVRVTAVATGSTGNSLALSTGAPTRIAVSNSTFWRGGGAAQVWNSRLVVPSSTTLIRPDGPNSANADWTTYSPTTGGANPDYTTLTAPSVAYETFEDTSGLFRSSGSLVFTGSFSGANALADLISGALEVYVFKVGGVGNTGPLPGNTRPLLLHGGAYNFATFDDGLTDGQVREATSSGNTINFTFGGFSMQDGIHVAWVITDPSIQINSVTATFF